MRWWGWILPACLLSAGVGIGGRWVAGADALPDVPVRIHITAPVAGVPHPETAGDSPRRIADEAVARGWTADDIRFAPLEGWPPPIPERRSFVTWRDPVTWPGMRVATDYSFVADRGRRRIPWGTAALAAAGLMMLAVRKW